MSKRNSNRKAAPVRGTTASNANTPKPTACRCGKQLPLAGFQAPRDGDNPLTEHLEGNPPWAGRDTLHRRLSVSPRDLRRLAEASAGRVIFSSRDDGGLRATIHADRFEALNCAAELRARGLAHFRRADEIEQVVRKMGVRT